MHATPFFARQRPDTSPLERAGFNPYYRELRGLAEGRALGSSGAYLDLASNDYLGLASDYRVIEAMVVEGERHGASMCGTPIATGYSNPYAALERELADFLDLEAAVVFPSCYQANTSVFACVAEKSDLVLVDHYAHASLTQGIRAVGCKVRPFLHNDLDHLERQLRSSGPYRQTFVVTESVFSTEGSLGPLADIVAVCGKYEAIPVVDDSHGVGVLGNTLRGALQHHGIVGFDGIYTASLGKALGQIGGVIAGSQSLIQKLRYGCPGLIYSTALPPAVAEGVRQTLAIIRNESEFLRSRLWANHRQLQGQLRDAGYTLASAEAPIASVQCGSTEATLFVARQFLEAGVLTTPFVPPSVPQGKGVVRLIVGAKLDTAGMERLVDAIERYAAVSCS